METTSHVESLCRTDGGPTDNRKLYNVFFICTSDLYVTKDSTRVATQIHVGEESNVQEELEQIETLKNMIRQCDSTITSIADLTLGQSLEYAISDMVHRSAHVIAFINDNDCKRARNPHRKVFSLSGTLEALTKQASRFISVLSCERSLFAKAFPVLAKFPVAFLNDSDLKERLVQSINQGKMEFRRAHAISSTGI